jgi:thermostable 8-oxoguanine DNA glycosylase
LEENEKTNLQDGARKYQLKHQQDDWQRMTETEIKDAVVYCIVSTQSRISTVESFRKATKGKSIWNLTIPEIERILREHHIRFPQKKAKWIASLAGKEFLPKLRELAELRNRKLASSRKVRYLLKKQLALKGLGDKQVSHLLTKWLGFCNDLVPLDSRWDNFFRQHGLFEEHDDPRYVILEDLILALANEIRVSPAELDEVVWKMMG